jgi:hypothetical protein
MRLAALDFLLTALVLAAWYVLSAWLVAPALGIGIGSALAASLLLLVALLAVLSALEYLARRLSGARLTAITGVPFDPTFQAYARHYLGQLRLGMSASEVQRILRGYAKIEASTRGADTAEIYVYRFGIIGRPKIEAWYDQSGLLAHFEGG